MAYLQFPDTLEVKTFDTGETIRMGSFSGAGGELKYIRVHMLIVGTLGGSEQLRLRVYGNGDYSVPIITSSYSSLSSFGSNKIGWVRVDFDRENIITNNTYYLAADINNYTRNGDTYYIGLVWDWPPVHATYGSSNLFHDNNIAFQIFTYS